MRKIIPFVAALFALAACSQERSAPPADSRAGSPSTGAALAANGPLLATAGLWEITASVDGIRAPGSNKVCVDAAVQKEHGPFGRMMGADAGCGTPRQRRIAGGFAYDLVCEQSGFRSELTGEARGDARHVVMVSTMRTRGPDGGDVSSVRTSMDARHIGPCPAGMRPGEMIEDGRKSSFVTSPDASRAEP